MHTLKIFLSSSLVAETHTYFKFGEMGCQEFESLSLHKLYNVPTNLAMLTGTTLKIFNGETKEG